MDDEGEEGFAILISLINKREKIHEELQNIEKEVYAMETNYLQDSSQCGNALKGFEGFLSSSRTTALLKRSRKFQPEDRLFSLSSSTSPSAQDQPFGREGISKAGGLYPSRHGKPRKERGGLREAKKIRLTADPNFDYDNDSET